MRSRSYPPSEHSFSRKDSRKNTRASRSPTQANIQRGDYIFDRDQDTNRHRGKRRRRENTFSISILEKCSEPTSWPRQLDNNSESNQRPRLATSSSQFSLFSRTEPVTLSGASRRHQPSESKGQLKGQEDFIPDLIRLRSSAFWELRQSIAENGEGLIQRMRDYEHTRSRHQIYQKAKEAEKRGRKRLARHKRVSAHPLPSDSSKSEDEEILISSGDLPLHTCWASSLGKRSRSLDTMDAQQNERAGVQQARCSSLSSYSHGQQNNDVREGDIGMECDDLTLDSLSPNVTPLCGRSSSSSSINESPDSSVFSLPLSTSPTHQIDKCLPSIANDKALNELSLALANGAGIVDYSSVRQYQERFEATELYDHGELWK